MVMEQLEKVAHLDLPKSVEILDRMINGDRDGWRIQGWQESLKNILAKAVSPGSAAREEANDVIEHLGRLGYTDFGELLAQ
jgi:hypothetical protein